MKRKILLILMFSALSFTCRAEDEKNEILFRDIPWGTTYKEVTNVLSDHDWYNMHHENMKTYSVDDIIYGDYEGIDFPNAGFNMVTYPFTDKEIDVAGYTTDDIGLFFAFPVVDGKILVSEEDALFYGARYEFVPENFDKMYEDLSIKLASLYGEPADKKEETDWLDIKTICTIWEGKNGTLVSLLGEDVKDEAELWDDSLCISYSWRGGDDLLTAASEAMDAEALENEESIYGNDDTSGL